MHLPAQPAETPKELLVGSLVTPNDLFYVRNHLPVPHIKPEEYKLKVEGEGLRSVRLWREGEGLRSVRLRRGRALWGLS